MTVMTRCRNKHAALLVGAVCVSLLAGGCTPEVYNLMTQQAFGIAGQVSVSMFGTLVASTQQVVLQAFPSMDILQVLLGVNRQPFFPG